jgi:hypothetical protein
VLPLPPSPTRVGVCNTACDRWASRLPRAPNPHSPQPSAPCVCALAHGQVPSASTARPSVHAPAYPQCALQATAFVQSEPRQRPHISQRATAKEVQRVHSPQHGYFKSFAFWLDGTRIRPAALACFRHVPIRRGPLGST